MQRQTTSLREAKGPVNAASPLPILAKVYDSK
jgi:hypothetical protein